MWYVCRPIDSGKACHQAFNLGSEYSHAIREDQVLQTKIPQVVLVEQAYDDGNFLYILWMGMRFGEWRPDTLKEAVVLAPNQQA